MGFFSNLFGGNQTPPVNALSNTRRDKEDIPGGRNNPWVCEPPPNLSELRKLFRQTLSGNNQTAALLPDDEDGTGLDSMIAEMVKMTLLREIFGEEGMDDAGFRSSLGGIPDVIRQLRVGHDTRKPALLLGVGKKCASKLSKSALAGRR